jgi:serine/threonine protein phosphatase PrpC
MALKANITRHGIPCSETHGSQDAFTAELWRDTLIAVLADGVGTAAAGGEAARRAVTTVTGNFQSRPRNWSVPQALEEFVQRINHTLHSESIAKFDRPEMLTTLAVAAIEGNHLCGLNVGDSRVYLLHADELCQLSQDQIEPGMELHHVLSQAVGMAPEVRPHTFTHAVEAGDLLLLCSDGLSNLIPDAELKTLLAQRTSARTLVAEARARATPETLDDISAVVVEIIATDPFRSTGQRLEIPETLTAGQVFEGFTLIRPFSQNERTWIASHEGRQVVLKFPPLQARDTEAVLNQFHKEIWTLTRLQEDFFIRATAPENARVLCYMMDYVEAPTLKETLRAGPLPLDEAVSLAAFLLDAGQFLLRLDLVHGDIKPENILVLRTGGVARFKLIDFGSISEVFSVTNRAGTPSYLAPERFHAAPCSERTELFAIGVTLFEALTAAFPYGEIEPFQTPHFGTPKLPTALNPNIPPWLGSVLLHAIAPEAQSRYQSYSEMKFDLENPTKVKPFFRKDAPLLERDPLLLLKLLLAASVAVNVLLVWKLLGR